jgi:hypothetical protein
VPVSDEDPAMFSAATVRLCLVPHGIQNAKCQILWNDEMQNAKIFIGVFSFI